MTISKVEYGEQRLLSHLTENICNLLGSGFRSLDKQGNNITGEFTPTPNYFFFSYC